MKIWGVFGSFCGFVRVCGGLEFECLWLCEGVCMLSLCEGVCVLWLCEGVYVSWLCEGVCEFWFSAIRGSVP